jgi:hypothetical protein
MGGQEATATGWVGLCGVRFTSERAAAGSQHFLIRTCLELSSTKSFAVISPVVDGF